MDMSKLMLVIEVAVESARNDDVSEEQAMRFLISKYDELKGEEKN